MNAMETLSPYELERGKPTPSRHHSKLQGRLTHARLSRYERQFDVLPELSLSFTTGDATPDRNAVRRVVQITPSPATH